MQLEIRPDDPRRPEATALVFEWLALAAELTPQPESRHAFSVDKLVDPRVSFFTAHLNGALVGCGALLRHDTALGEVKSMFVRPTARGRGLAKLILSRIEAEARAAGLRQLSLETGATFAAALSLYQGAGFKPCGPFAHYRADPNSAFLTKAL